MKIDFQVFFRNLKIWPQWTHVPSGSSLLELSVSRLSLQEQVTLQLTRPPATLSLLFIIVLLLLLFE